MKTPTGRRQPVGYLQAWVRIWMQGDQLTNPASQQSGTWTWDCRIAGLTQWPLGHAASLKPKQESNLFDQQKDLLNQCIITVTKFFLFCELNTHEISPRFFVQSEKSVWRWTCTMQFYIGMTILFYHTVPLVLKTEHLLAIWMR